MIRSNQTQPQFRQQKGHTLSSHRQGGNTREQLSTEGKFGPRKCKHAFDSGDFTLLFHLQDITKRDEINTRLQNSFFYCYQNQWSGLRSRCQDCAPSFYTAFDLQYFDTAILTIDICRWTSLNSVMNFLSPHANRCDAASVRIVVCSLLPRRNKRLTDLVQA